MITGLGRKTVSLWSAHDSLAVAERPPSGNNDSLLCAATTKTTMA